MDKKETRKIEADSRSPGEESTVADRPQALQPLDLLAVEIGYGLIPLVDTEQGGDLLDRVGMIRRQLAAGRRRVLQHEKYLCQGVLAEMALRLEGFDQGLERQVLVGVGAERILANSLEQLAERRLAQGAIPGSRFRQKAGTGLMMLIIPIRISFRLAGPC
mgnify:CR=1 FL=1